MPVPAGTKLGPYEVVAKIGAGGMGEVYRARDPRLGRDVAIKLLPAAMASDALRLRRFEQEARAASALNHPNILSVYDVGSHQGSPYLVTELLEGQTLREQNLGLKKALDVALQVARGLAAAHQKGIVHRDLKPENLFVTKDGRAKILDFGLAKLVQAPPEGDETAAMETQPGVILGTAAYMSPEQARGQAAGARSDLFSFGAILYELIGGERAFQRDSAVETMNAVLNSEPPPLDAAPALERIVRHCLEKDPDQRFQSAQDLAFALEALAGSTAAPAPLPIQAAPSRRRVLRTSLAGAGIAAASAGFYALGRWLSGTAPPVFRRVTFQHDRVRSARFAPDGETIVYAASERDGPPQLYVTRVGVPEARPLGISNAQILAISAAGEMAIAMRYSLESLSGTLARVPLTGGAPREILENVNNADWSPDGKDLAVIRPSGSGRRIEYPIGKELYKSNEQLAWLRVSPNGEELAFFEGYTAGTVSLKVVDLSGRARTLSTGWATAAALAWTPDGNEIWFGASHTFQAYPLYAVTRSGKQRLLVSAPGTLMIQNIARNGRALVIHSTIRAGILWRPPGETEERDLSWLDQSAAEDISADGKLILITVSGAAVGGPVAVYLRKTDGSPAVRLGEGAALALSGDGRSVLALLPASRQIAVLPTGAGETKMWSDQGRTLLRAWWFPEERRVLLAGSEAGRGVRLYVQDMGADRMPQGAVRPITPEGVDAEAAISPDGRMVAAVGPDRRLTLYPADGSAPRTLAELAPGTRPLRWSADGVFLFVDRREGATARIYRVFLAEGRADQWTEISGIAPSSRLVMTPDGRSYAYSYSQNSRDLYVLEGLR